MFKKKKTTLKENTANNNQPNKKIGPLNLPSFCLQEPRIKTLPSTEIRALCKTVELQKEGIHSKKNISRKTTSRTMRMESSLKPAHLKNLLNKVKSIHEPSSVQLNKSKSPAKASSKSTKRITIKNKSQNRFSLKIDDTLRNIQFCDLIVDGESNIVYPSVSTRPHHQKNISNVSDIEDIDLKEMLAFRSAFYPQRLKVDLKSGDSLQEVVAAITIQRAWRKYRTKKLVERYAQSTYSLIFTSNHQSGGDPLTRFDDINDDLIIVPSDDFYGETVEEDIRQISNLEQEQEGDNMEEKMQSIKKEELEKWDQILHLIQRTKDSSEEEREKIFMKIAEQSERNRQELIKLTEKKHKKISKTAKKTEIKESAKIQVEEVKQSINQEEERSIPDNLKTIDIMDSGHRVKSEEESQSQTGNYNANKYIECLNSDSFTNEIPDSTVQLAGIKISERKKQMLLEVLRTKPVRLAQGGHHSSLSQTQLQEQLYHKDEASLMKTPASLRRSTSEKILKRTLSQLTDSEYEQKVDLQMLEEQYLEAYPILIEDTEDNNYQVQMPPVFSSELQQEQKLQTPVLEQRVKPDSKTLSQEFHDLLGGLTEIEIQPVEESFSQEVMDNHQNQINLEKADELAGLIITDLSMEILKDISKSDSLACSLKRYALSLKPKVRRTIEGQRKKKGFPTDKKQIQLFLQNFIGFLIREEFNTLNNLEVSTGPSALQMLKYMHSNDEESVNGQSQNQNEEPNIMVIPNRIFDIFWKIKEKSIIVEVPPNFTEENTLIFRQNIEYLKSFNKIFYRSLFDTFNQCLDYERNYGILGKPFPWKNSSYFQHQFTEVQKKEGLENARNRMIAFATTYCGLILDTQQIGSTADNQNYLQQVQQDRLSRMLANDLLDSEPRWQFYDDEEAQILIEISSIIYREILFEVMEFICDFQ